MTDFAKVSYHHIHFYVKSLQDISAYKKLESTFGSFLTHVDGNFTDVKAGSAAWTKAAGEAATPSEYKSQNQDLVEQLISGVGWRVTAAYSGPETSSMVVSSPDPAGARFIITAPRAASGANPTKKAKVSEARTHFSAAPVNHFFGCHANKQGCAVLGFQAASGQVAEIYGQYKAKHPKLLVNKDGAHEYKHADGSAFKVLEVYAYYSPKDKTAADEGTVLRFVESSGGWADTILPGLEPVAAKFELETVARAYFDHWVSNVVDRQQFLSTLQDTLGFVPKVDFNAGVVAAGEAIIESTVTGNSPAVVITSPAESLINQEQVYLPINNALSEVGHVAGYLKELGQGIQHLASRVQDLVGYVQRANFVRKTTGQGFCFLNIPPSYYGRLTKEDLVGAGLSAGAASGALEALIAAKLVSVTGIVDVDVQDAAIRAAPLANKKHQEEYKTNSATVVKVVRKAVYSNLYGLLRDHLDEQTYLSIVRNKVLVDIQGNDVLYQIFTAPVLQQEAKDEAPFLEFIQRVCSNKKGADGQPVPIRPGCGGFGIRNFLTLFLSIEVSKAMMEQEKALASGAAKAIELANAKVAAFTEQLDVSNPILTRISDAMTLEGDLRTRQKLGGTAAAVAALGKQVAAAAADKEAGNQELQTVSDRYKTLLAGIRTKQNAL